MTPYSPLLDRKSLSFPFFFFLWTFKGDECEHEEPSRAKSPDSAWKHIIFPFSWQRFWTFYAIFNQSPLPISMIPLPVCSALMRNPSEHLEQVVKQKKNHWEAFERDSRRLELGPGVYADFVRYGHVHVRCHTSWYTMELIIPLVFYSNFVL